MICCSLHLVVALRSSRLRPSLSSVLRPLFAPGRFQLASATRLSPRPQFALRAPTFGFAQPARRS